MKLMQLTKLEKLLLVELMGIAPMSREVFSK